MFRTKKGKPRKSRCEERMSGCSIEPRRDVYWKRIGPSKKRGREPVVADRSGSMHGAPMWHDRGAPFTVAPANLPLGSHHVKKEKPYPY